MPRARVSLPWAVFGLALVLRLVHLVTIRNCPFVSILYIDPLMYDEWARRIAAGHLLSDRPFFLDPLYPYLLGAIYAIAGHHVMAAIAVQSVVGAAVAPLALLTARRWFDPATAVLAGLIAAVYLPGIYFGGLIMKPGLTLALVALGLWLLSEALAGRGGAGWWLSGGLVLGLACLTRGNLVLVMPGVVAWILLRGDATARPLLRRAADAGRRRQAAMAATGIAAVLIVPALHNYVVGGELILTTANAGANFYIGNNPDNHSGEYQQLPFIRANPKHEQSDFAAEAARRAGHALNDRETSAFWFAESFAWIRGHPLAWLALLGRKLHAFWGAYEIPDSLDYELYREFAPVLRLPIPGFGLLAPLALLGMLLARRRTGWPRLAMWLVALYAASIVAFFVFSRFRMAVAPALFVFAAFGASELARRMRRLVRDGSGWRPALASTVVFLAAAAFVNVPVRARVDSLGYRFAGLVGLPRVAETSSLGHFNLGVAYAGAAKEADDPAAMLARAEGELRRALELARDLNHARIHVELGKVLAREGKNDEAIRIYRQGLQYEPGDFAIHHALGLLSLRVGDRMAAAEAFDHALQLAPRFLPSAMHLGQVLLELERPTQAARVFRHALDVDPDNADAAAGLARAEELTRRQSD